MKTFLKKAFVFTFVAISLILTSKYSYSITDTLDANIDNTLYEDQFGSRSNGKGQYFFTGVSLIDFAKRGLVSFGIAEKIPPGSVISDVKLVLHMSRTTSTGHRVFLHKVTNPWGEGNSVGIGEEGSGGPSEPGDATWIHKYYNNQFWNNSGGDFLNTESGFSVVDGIGFYSWNDPQMALDVQGWVNNVSPDYGWILIGDESGSGTTKRFDSKDNVNPSVRPKLIITYTLGSIALRMRALTEGLIQSTLLSSVIPPSYPDTFRVYLRNSFSPYSIVDSAISFTESESWYLFNNAPSGSYYIMVNQRNTINTWSKLPLNLSTGAAFYDFTSAISQAYGNNLVLKSSNYCFFSGDVNKDNFINLTDILNIFNSANIFQTGYVVTDVNGDSIVDLTDLVITFNNAGIFVQEQRP